ncbi:hypothetical protein ACN27J_18540 [Solwaraspora sp. WMMB762]|uniref:hypothetical protein n=1 Tax=Solwaraspora sp. WMMB762 TaxID=3404120 RepID=UPI003B92D83B
MDRSVQNVHRDVPPRIIQYDWSGLADQDERSKQLIAEDVAAGFDPAVPPMRRLQLIKFDGRIHGVV